MSGFWLWLHEHQGYAALFLLCLVVGAGLLVAVWNLARSARLDRQRFAVEAAAVRAEIRSRTGSTQVLSPRAPQRFPAGRATVVPRVRRSSDEEAA